MKFCLSCQDTFKIIEIYGKRFGLPISRFIKIVRCYRVQRLGDSMDGPGSNFGRGNNFSSSLKPLDHSQSHWHRDSLSGKKRPGRDADRSPPSSAEVKHEWRYASTPLVLLRGVNMDNFTFL